VQEDPREAGQIVLFHIGHQTAGTGVEARGMRPDELRQNSNGSQRGRNRSAATAFCAIAVVPIPSTVGTSPAVTALLPFVFCDIA